MSVSTMQSLICTEKPGSPCKPHFYPTDSLSLDAKGMDIKTVSMNKGNQQIPLKYNYDGSTLTNSPG